MDILSESRHPPEDRRYSAVVGMMKSFQDRVSGADGMGGRGDRVRHGAKRGDILVATPTSGPRPFN